MCVEKEQYTIKILTEKDIEKGIEIYIDAYSKEPWNEVYRVESATLFKKL